MGGSASIISELSPKNLSSSGKATAGHPEAQNHEIRILRASHETFPPELRNETVSLMIWNLGFLPGATTNKNTTKTEAATTLNSISNAVPLIAKGGALSISLYPGHSGNEASESGEREGPIPSRCVETIPIAPCNSFLSNAKRLNVAPLCPRCRCSIYAITVSIIR
eukprot:jgi/Bigna1/60597/fgenesh1_kg.13_\